MKKINFKKILLIVLICIIILSYFFYKGFNYYIYRPNNISDKIYDEFMDSFDIHDDITMNKQPIEDNNYIIYKNIKIRNDFTNYVIVYEGTDGRTYRLNDESGNSKAIFRIGIQPQFYDSILDEAMFKKSDKEEFFKKYNIKNDLDLLDFVLEKHNTKNNIFTPVKKMKEHAMIQYFTFVTLSNPSYITKINGDYNGFIIGNEKAGQINLTLKNINTVNILKDNKVYYFGFWLSEEFTEEYIKNIINTIIIEENDINTFTRTYQILDITKSQTTGKSYLKLKTYQSEEETTVEVYNDFLTDVKKNEYYEFSFQKNNNQVEDNIKSIFENTNLISVTLTDREGLNQKQESIK